MHRSRWLATPVLLLLLVAGCAQVPTTPEPPPLPTTAQAGDTTIVAVAPAQQEKQCCSIWNFLGVGQIAGGLQAIGTRIRSRLGSRFPGLEPRPPLLTITDPANLGPEASPAVQTAAEVKAEEDQAPQKAKAINYLSTIGCGGCDRGVEDALLAALDDCTEEVRFAAAKALRDLSGNPCAVCKTDSCCSEKALKKLNKIAYDTKNGCYVEPSPRVRRMARLTLAGCGGFVTTEGVEQGGPEEGPTPADLPPPEGEGQSVLHGGGGVRPVSAQVRQHDPVMAEVNGEPIFLSQLAPRVQARLESMGGLRVEPTDEMRRSIEQRELQRLIDRRLLVGEAREHLPTDQLRRVGYQTLVSPGRRPEKILADAGAHLGMDEEQLVRRWLDQHVTINDVVEQRDVVRHYQTHLADYQSPSLVSWEQISVPVSAGASPHHALTVVRYLRGVAIGQPTSPAPIFQRQDVSNRTYPLTRIDRVGSRGLAQLLLNLPLARISEPWQDETGWHLVRVLERRPAETQSLDKVHEQVREAVLEARRNDAERAYVQQLRQQASIWTVFDREMEQPGMGQPGMGQPGMGGQGVEPVVPSVPTGTAAGGVGPRRAAPSGQVSVVSGRPGGPVMERPVTGTPHSTAMPSTARW